MRYHFEPTSGMMVEAICLNLLHLKLEPQGRQEMMRWVVDLSECEMSGDFDLSECEPSV